MRRHVLAVRVAPRRQVQGAVQPRASAVGRRAALHRALDRAEHRPEPRRRRAALRRLRATASSSTSSASSTASRTAARRDDDRNSDKDFAGRVFAHPFKTLDIAAARGARLRPRRHLRQPHRRQRRGATSGPPVARASSATPNTTVDRQRQPVAHRAAGSTGSGARSGSWASTSSPSRRSKARSARATTPRRRAPTRTPTAGSCRRRGCSPARTASYKMVTPINNFDPRQRSLGRVRDRRPRQRHRHRRRRARRQARRRAPTEAMGLHGRPQLVLQPGVQDPVQLRAHRVRRQADVLRARSSSHEDVLLTRFQIAF